MSFFSRLNRTHLAAAFGAGLAIGCGLFLNEFPLGSGLVRSSYDFLHVLRGDVAAQDAVIVCLDEVSHDKLGQPKNAPTWDRALHAKLIERLTAAGAKAIVFDVVFTDPSLNNPGADEKQAAAMKQSGRVILAADNVRIGPGMKQISPLFDMLRDTAASMGSDELLPDADLVVRQHTPEEQLPSLSWAAAEFVKPELAQENSVRSAQRWMNYYGPPNFIPWESYYRALDPAAVRDEFFRGKTVFVGARMQTLFAGDRKDQYPNPFSSWLHKDKDVLFSDGVEIQATAFLNLVRGDWLRRLSFGQERLILIVSGLAFGWGLVRLHPLKASAVAAAGLVLAGGFFFYLFTRKLTWFPFLIIETQIVGALSWSILFNSLQLYVQKRLYEQTLRLYLPPKLVKKFSKSREFLKPGAETQTLTLLFSDIANFTSMSEGMHPNELAGLMNAYFQVAVSKCIHKADGTVAKFIGDAIFAFWNAPDEQANHALLACQAALFFREQAAQPIQGKLLPTRIGLHTGEANVGNFGSDERVDYTALGENVNLASRLEGLNKHLGTECLISGATKAAVGDGLVTRGLGKFQLKGFEGLVDVHELVGWPHEAEATRPWREAFAEALNNYEQRNLEFAEMGFRRVQELRPEDGPSKFYLSRITELAAQSLPESWVTHTILKEK